jgi:hypothetical protein
VTICALLGVVVLGFEYMRFKVSGACGGVGCGLEILGTQCFGDGEGEGRTRERLTRLRLGGEMWVLGPMVGGLECEAGKLSWARKMATGVPWICCGIRGCDGIGTGLNSRGGYMRNRSGRTSRSRYRISGASIAEVKAGFCDGICRRLA